MKAGNRIFTEIFWYVFKLWSCIFVLYFLPLDSVYIIDSIIKYLSPAELAVDVSIMVISFVFISFVIALFFASVSWVGGFIREEAVKKSVLRLNNLAAFLFISLFFIKTFKLWITHTFHLYYSLSGSFLAVAVLVLIFLAYFFWPAIERKISEESPKLFKATVAVSVTAVLLMGLHVVKINMPDYGQPENRDESDHRRQVADKSLNLPNIILVSFDALTSEDMSLYGYERNTTPNINQFALGSYVFENMYSNSNWTTPSILSMLTGKYPSSHKGTLKFLPQWYSRENIANILKKSGYHTAAVISNRFAYPLYIGTHEDFDYLPDITYEEKYKSSIVGFPDSFFYSVTPYLIKLKSTSYHWYMHLFDNYYTKVINKSFLQPILWREWENRIPNPPSLTFKIADEYLAKAEEPFFLWIHNFPPHLPYIPPEEFKYTFLDEKIYDSLSAQLPILGFMMYPDDVQPKLDKARARYDEHILYLDHEFGKFLYSLKQKGLYESSVLILTSDHGESFEKGYHGHGGPFLHQSLIHVPLIIKLPSQKGGRRISSNAELIDIPPTILDIINSDIPAWMEGESLKRNMEEEYNSGKPKFSMNLLMNFVKGPINKGSVAVMKEGYKYVYYLDYEREELFNLNNDPKELNNLADTEKEKAGELKKLIYQNILKKTTDDSDGRG